MLSCVRLWVLTPNILCTIDMTKCNFTELLYLQLNSGTFTKKVTIGWYYSWNVAFRKFCQYLRWRFVKRMTFVRAKGMRIFEADEDEMLAVNNSWVDFIEDDNQKTAILFHFIRSLLLLDVVFFLKNVRHLQRYPFKKEYEE